MIDREKNKELLKDLSVDDLFSQSFDLTRKIYDDYDEELDDFLLLILIELKYRATKDIALKCQLYSKSNLWEERIVAARIFSELGVKRPEGKDVSFDHGNIFRQEKETTYLDLLKNESNDRVLEATIYALGHFPIEGAIPNLILHKNHKDPDIRQALAWILGDYSHQLAASTLLELMQDEDEDVRNYATWSIGSNSYIDTPEVREALFNRLFDGDEEVEHEALMGLCRRNDKRGITRLIDLLEIRELDYFILDIAIESKSIDILSTLKAISESQLNDPSIRRDWEKAVLACGGSIE